MNTQNIFPICSEPIQRTQNYSNVSRKYHWMKNRFSYPMNFNPKPIYDIFAIRIKFEAHERKGETLTQKPTY